MNLPRTSSEENAQSALSRPKATTLTFATPIRGFRFPPEFASRLEDLRPRRKGDRAMKRR